MNEGSDPSGREGGHFRASSEASGSKYRDEARRDGRASGGGRDSRDRREHDRGYDRDRSRDRQEHERDRDRERPRSRSRERAKPKSEGGKEGGRAPEGSSKRGRGWDVAPPGAPGAAPAAPPPPPALAPADMVRLMMAAPGGATAPAPPASTSGLTLAQKKKLLWGAKKAEATVSAVLPAAVAPQGALGPAEAVYGTNRWDVAEFSSDAEKTKFCKLMGVKATVAGPAPPPRPAGPSAAAHTAMDREAQARVLHDVEEAFARGLAQTGAKKGLGADDAP